MNELETIRTQEIVQLHGEIIDHFRRSLEKAIRIGELLLEQKGSLKHGEFGEWVKKNLPFTDRTARNYMKLYQERDRLKTETVSDLTDAYRLLSSPKISPWVEDTLGELIAMADLVFDENEIKEILTHFGFDPEKVERKNLVEVVQKNVSEADLQPLPLDEENWDFDESIKRIRELKSRMQENIVKGVQRLAGIRGILMEKNPNGI